MIVALALGLLALPLTARAQSAPTPTAGAVLSPPQAARPNDSFTAVGVRLPPLAIAPQPVRLTATAIPATPDLLQMQMSARASLSRHLLVGAMAGGIAGAAFGLWVISMADCAGPHCTPERVLGVAGTTLGGAAVGALLGGVVYLIRR